MLREAGRHIDERWIRNRIERADLIDEFSDGDDAGCVTGGTPLMALK
jgi:hypothetical protein